MNLRLKYKMELFNYFLFYHNHQEIIGIIKEVPKIYVTIAFNKPEYIEIQNKLINKFEQSDFIHVIADNSTEQDSCQKIKEFCEKNEFGNILYVRLPRLMRGKTPKHGACLNYVMKNVIWKYYRKSDVILIDHDIFPIKQIKNVFDDRLYAYGDRQERIVDGELKWYLWPGYTMIRDNDICPINKMDFLQCRGLDTGGRNYNRFYRKIDKKESDRVRFASKKYIKLFPDNEKITDDNTENICELLDEGWLHYIGGAWRIIQRKNEEFFKIINEKLYQEE